MSCTVVMPERRHSSAPSSVRALTSSSERGGYWGGRAYRRQASSGTSSSVPTGARAGGGKAGAIAAMVGPAIAMSAIAGRCQSVSGRMTRPPATMRVVPAGKACGVMCYLMVQRQALVATRKEAVVIDIGERGRVVEAEGGGHLLDVVRQPGGVKSADALAPRVRRDDQAAAQAIEP